MQNETRSSISHSHRFVVVRFLLELSTPTNRLLEAKHKPAQNHPYYVARPITDRYLSALSVMNSKSSPAYSHMFFHYALSSSFSLVSSMMCILFTAPHPPPKIVCFQLSAFASALKHSYTQTPPPEHNSAVQMSVAGADVICSMCMSLCI